MWMDTDAVVHNFETPIDKAGKPEKTFICSPDPSGIGMSAQFNAGVWIVKNTDVGRAIMNSWMSAYDPVHWTDADGKWIAKQGWAGETFEQGAFEKNILPRYRSSIEILPWHILQGIDAHRTDSFALHLFSYGPALAIGLIRMDSNVLRVLRTKHTQGISSTIPPGLLLSYKVNLGAALLDMANRSCDPREFRALYDEAERVLLSGIELEHACDNCRLSLASARTEISAADGTCWIRRRVASVQCWSDAGIRAGANINLKCAIVSRLGGSRAAHQLTSGRAVDSCSPY